MDRKRIMDELQSTQIDQRFLIDALYCIEREILAAASRIRSIAQEDKTTTNLELSMRVDEVTCIVSEMTKNIQDAAVKSEVDLRKIAVETVKGKLIPEVLMIDPNEKSDEDVLKTVNGSDLPQNFYISNRLSSTENSSVPQTSESSNTMPTSQELKVAAGLPSGVYFVKESQFVPVSNFSSRSISPKGFSSHKVNGKLLKMKTLKENATFFAGHNSSSGSNCIEGKLVALKHLNEESDSVQHSNSSEKARLPQGSNPEQQLNSSRRTSLPQELNNEPEHFLEVKTPEGSKRVPVINLSEKPSSSQVPVPIRPKAPAIRKVIPVNTDQGLKMVPLSCLSSKTSLTKALPKRQESHSAQVPSLPSQSSTSQGNSEIERSSSSEQSNPFRGSLLAQMLSRTESVPRIETYECS